MVKTATFSASVDALVAQNLLRLEAHRKALPGPEFYYVEGLLLEIHANLHRARAAAEQIERNARERKRA